MIALRQFYPVQRTLMAVNSSLPEKDVRRHVQGVDLLLPRSHPLPLFTQEGSPYGANLVDLARGLGAGGELTMLDVGGNVGDSTARSLQALGGRGNVVCVEPDPAWLPYLRANTSAYAGVVIEEAFLVPDARAARGVAPVHHSPGTTRFEASAELDRVASLTPDELLARHPRLEGVRLVKTDTDGFDVSLVPAMARAFAGSHPVIFFEYDPRLTRIACPEVDPASVWDELESLGYRHLGIWDHGGTPVGRCATAKVRGELHRLQPGSVFNRRRAKGYWDVAAVHAEDAEGRALVERLLPSLG